MAENLSEYTGLDLAVALEAELGADGDRGEESYERVAALLDEANKRKITILPGVLHLNAPDELVTDKLRLVTDKLREMVQESEAPLNVGM